MLLSGDISIILSSSFSPESGVPEKLLKLITVNLHISEKLKVGLALYKYSYLRYQFDA